MHPVVGYLLSYPPNWKGGLQEIPQGSKQDYQDFNIQSPDYKFSTEGYPTLEQGSEVFVRAEKTDKSSIDDIYNGDLSAEIGKNKIYTTVDNQQAIQFDFSYEGVEATMTIFLKNGIHYTIKLIYVGEIGKQAMWNNYLKLLNSFKVK